MDTETAAAIEQLRDEFGGLRREFSGLRGEFSGLRGEFSGLRGEFSELRAELRSELADVRRHAVMLNESTRDDIRLVAEAVAVLTIKVDSLRR